MGSTTGCWTCRIRKKKCDEANRGTGSCDTCVRIDVDCLGWGSKRPRWAQDKKLLARYKASIRISTRGRSGHQSRAQSRSISNDSEEANNTLVAVEGNNSGSQSTLDWRQDLAFGPHPHDFQPDLPLLTLRQCASDYWRIAYEYHTDLPSNSNSLVSHIINALLQEAPLSPLASLVVSFPALHTQVSSGRRRQWIPHESAHFQNCRQIVASFRPGSRVRDDHIIAAAYCIGLVPIVMSPTVSQPKLISLVESALKHSSIIPRQSLHERTSIIQGMMSSTGPRLLSILTGKPQEEDLWSMEEDTKTAIRETSMLALWRSDQVAHSSLDQSDFLQRAKDIQDQLSLSQFHGLSPNSGYPYDERRKCGDVHRATAHLYLHCVWNESNPNAPKVAAGVDLVIGLLACLDSEISSCTVQSLLFPIAITLAVIRRPEHETWLYQFAERHGVFKYSGRSLPGEQLEM